MGKIHRLLVVALGALVMIGCCNCRHKAMRNTLPLEGTTWQLIQLGGQSVKAQGESFTLQVLAEEHQMAAMGSCNRLTAGYTTDERRNLALSEIGSTRMLCPEAELEQKFVEALSQTTRYDMDGEMLLLLHNNDLIAVLQAKK